MSLNLSTVVKGFIESHHLLAPSDKIIVGLSGGADSVALLLILSHLGYDCLAAHCNFHLRNEESTRDEDFCRGLCSRHGIEIIVRDFDVPERCRATGESIEMACRGLRYEWWNSLLCEGKGSVIAVGHHKEDNVETFFLNLLRGSGIAGLKAMMPRAINIIRPLLETSKAEILAYLEEMGESFVVDSSNLSNDYKRNRLRNLILPEIEKMFPGAMDSIAYSVTCLRENYDLYTCLTDRLREKYIGKDGVVDLNRIIANEQDARMVIFEILSKTGINMSQVDNILVSLNSETANRTSGQIFKATGISYLLNRGKLIPLQDEEDSNDTISIKSLDNPPFSCYRMDTGVFFTRRTNKTLDSSALYLDSRVLEGDPVFTLRPWFKGDRIRPYGMKGSRLVSDLLSDAKYSLADKRNVRILAVNDKILWVIGLRASSLFSISEETPEVLEITYKND
ncbi:MAG: tRNA lysidine(34) synthetase TilS [Staphylococcus sp.]|nr:tRNA lysidine(34) synthetase TilS [Staphylococcus sp.]